MYTSIIFDNFAGKANANESVEELVAYSTRDIITDEMRLAKFGVIVLIYTGNICEISGELVCLN